MREILIVVDAQNGYCHPRGCKIRDADEKTKSAFKKTVARMGVLVSRARAWKIPCLYLCTNKKLVGSDLDWEVAIHDEIAPKETDRVFWRKNPDDNPFTNRGLCKFLEKFSHPRLLLCGFYSTQCVARTTLHALERGIPVVVLTDFVSSPTGEATEEMYGMYEKFFAGWSRPINRGLFSFHSTFSS